MKPDAKRAEIADRAKKPAKKIDRSAFLYMVDHDGDAYRFAQCAGCRFFNGKDCAVIGIPVKADWSCGLFTDGAYDGMAVQQNVPAEEAGVYKGQVRCENCRYGGERCALYDRMNKEMPADFDLDSKIEPKACCNAFTAKS